MKTSITAILALAGAATVAATDFPKEMPDCGKFCGTDMLGKAAEFNCKGGDIACMCKDPNFTFGIHDCSVESCPSITDANKVIGWGKQLCDGVNVPVTVSSVGSVAGTASASGSPVTNTGDADATTTGSGNGSSETGDATGDATATAIATSTWTSTFTNGDETSTVTGTTTISGINGVPVTADEPETTVTSPIVSTHTGESTTFETTIGSTTITGDDAQNTGSNGEGSGASTSTSSAEGAHMTAAPAFGFLAAAGIAAAFL